MRRLKDLRENRIIVIPLICSRIRTHIKMYHPQKKINFDFLFILQ